MAMTGKRPLKRKIVTVQGEQDSKTSGGFRVRLDAKTVGALAVFLLVVATLAIYVKRAGEPLSTPAGGAVGGIAPVVAGNGRPADTQPVQNRPPSVVLAAITTSDPDASTSLQVRYSASDPEGDPITFDIRWFVDDNLVQTGPSDVLQPGAYRKGSSVYAEVIPADRQSSGNAYKTSPVIIKNSPPRISSLVLEPETVFIGAVITATPSGTDPDGDPVEYVYQWRVNGSPVEHATGGNTFDTAALRKRDVVSVAVEASDGQMKGGMAVSNDIPLKNGKPEFISSPQAAPRDGLYLYRAEARDPDGDILKYRLGVYPEGMTIDPASGTVRWEIQKGVLYAGKHELSVQIIVDDGDGGVATQEFVIVLTDYIAN